ncbi:MAG: hypothetical protein ABH818_01575 [Patescibacteria group bacterium]
MKKKLFFLLSVFGLNLLFAKKVLAICPVCTVVVSAGIELSRLLGIDDVITGLWIGGLIVSLIIWTESWFDKKNIQFKARIIITTLGYYLLIIIPLYYLNILGDHKNDLLCFCNLHLDKLLLGMIVGSISFYFSSNLYSYLKEKNNNHAHFSFQKVVIPVFLLILLSIIFYFLTN